MANRIMLNQTSYHGAGAIQEIVNEAKAHGFKKAFVCSDPDLVKFNVTSKVTDLLKENGLDYELYSDIKPNPTIENVQHGVQPSVLSLRTRNLKMSEVSKVWLRPKNLAYRSSPYLPQPELLRK